MLSLSSSDHVQSSAGVQSEDEIRRLMREAQSAPNKYSFNTVEEPDYSMMIDEEIDDNMEESHRAKASGTHQWQGGATVGAGLHK